MILGGHGGRAADRRLRARSGHAPVAPRPPGELRGAVVAGQRLDKAVDAGIRAGVAEAASRHGLLLADTAPMTAGQIAPGMVRVVLSRSRAEVRGCPDWSLQSNTNSDARTSPNYGCATNANMAAMVADPIDLVRGQRAGVSDPVTASKAIEKYRRGTTGGAAARGAGVPGDRQPGRDGHGRGQPQQSDFQRSPSHRKLLPFPAPGDPGSGSDETRS